MELVPLFATDRTLARFWRLAAARFALLNISSRNLADDLWAASAP
jgi:hypothetical protein